MKLVLFGSGYWGKEAYSFFGDANVFCFCDNAVNNGDEKWVCGKRVLSFDELIKMQEECIIVVCLAYGLCLEVCKQMDDAGIKDYLVYDMFRESERTADEISVLFQNERELEKLYKECYRYLAGKSRRQLQYLKRHADIRTLKPAIGELRKRQLDLLVYAKEFFEFINQLDLKPFLAYGSLLGAARHQGFIPWDDDIDFGLIRNEYEKLLQFAHESEECAVLMGNEGKWVDWDGNFIESGRIPKIYPDKYIFNLRPYTLQISRCIEGKQHYVMDIWAYDFYKSEYDIRKHMELVNKINDEAQKIENNKDKVNFFRLKQKNNSGVSLEMTENFFPGIDNFGGYPGLKTADSWIPSKEIFPLKKVTFENTVFWAPNNMEALLRYVYRSFAEFPDDVGTIKHTGAEAE